MNHSDYRASPLRDRQQRLVQPFFVSKDELQEDNRTRHWLSKLERLAFDVVAWGNSDGGLIHYCFACKATVRSARRSSHGTHYEEARALRIKSMHTCETGEWASDLLARLPGIDTYHDLDDAGFQESLAKIDALYAASNDVYFPSAEEMKANEEARRLTKNT